MKERELLSLPLGEYKLYNDDNFNKNKFNLRIYFCDSMKQRRYIIQESMNLNGATFHLYETEDYVFEDQRRDGYFKKSIYLHQHHLRDYLFLMGNHIG